MMIIFNPYKFKLYIRANALDFKFNVSYIELATVERMFSISDHIFPVKRRRLHHKYLPELVFKELGLE